MTKHAVELADELHFCFSAAFFANLTRRPPKDQSTQEKQYAIKKTLATRCDPVLRTRGRLEMR